MSKLQNEKLVDIWLEHSNKLWRAVYATPIVTSAIFVGWYVLFRDGQRSLAIMVLVVGIVILVIHFLIIRRIAQFDGALMRELGDAIPNVGAPLFGLHGRALAQFVPTFLVIVLLLLAVFSATAPS